MPRLDKNPEAGKHYYHGDLAPGISGRSMAGQITFSVGIFEMVPKASGKGLKKRATAVRVHGYCSDPEAVYRLADEICRQLDARTYRGSKQRWA